MSDSAVVNEFAKMRRLHLAPVGVLLVAAVVTLSLLSALTSPEFDDPDARSLLLLSGMSLAVPMVAPLLLAVLASRHVDIEHQGNGWLLAQSCGLTPGALCRAKLLALGSVVAAATVLQGLLLLACGLLSGAATPVPLGLWLGYTAAVLVVHLVLLSLHILVSARVDNQLMGLGLGVLGTLFAFSATGLPDWLAHMLPWGYYALVTAAGYRDGVLVALTPSYPSIAALGIITAAVFLLVTRLFDRREA